MGFDLHVVGVRFDFAGFYFVLILLGLLVWVCQGLVGLLVWWLTVDLSLVCTLGCMGTTDLGFAGVGIIYLF